MTTWTNATENEEYVEPDYMESDYVIITYEIHDGSGTTWGNATEQNPTWTNQ